MATMRGSDWLPQTTSLRLEVTIPAISSKIMKTYTHPHMQCNIKQLNKLTDSVVTASHHNLVAGILFCQIKAMIMKQTKLTQSRPNNILLFAHNKSNDLPRYYQQHQPTTTDNTGCVLCVQPLSTLTPVQSQTTMCVSPQCRAIHCFISVEHKLRGTHSSVTSPKK